MSTHHDGQFVISTGADSRWHGTKAKTIHGAKNIAGRSYQYTRGSRVEIAIFREKLGRYEIVAIKDGHAPWRTAPTVGAGK